MTKTFQELGLNSDIIKAITELGYQTPTPVQGRIIPTILEEEGDIVCLAQTGTGKTAAFGLPALNAIIPEILCTQVLVLCPTRELCRQIAQDLKNYAKYIKNFSIADVYGGAGIEPQIRAVKKNPHVIVATPGRLLDLINRRAVNLKNITTVILDEADEMLNMGFKDDLDSILEATPEEKRVLLFSATLPIEVEKIAKTYMKNAEVVTVGERNSGSNNVKHYCFMVHEKDRYGALKRIVDYYPEIYGIIFCRTRRETGEIASALIKDGYDADAIHGDLSQQQRDQVMKRFKEKTLKLLVATDVAARGIDVNNLSHVINYNLPDEVEQYTHRSGRTGRAGNTGKSVVIINTKEQNKIRRIEKIINKTFAMAKLPTGQEVCSKQLLALIDQINAVEVKEEIQQYLPLVMEKWADISREEIINKFLSMEFNRFLDYYRNAPELNIQERSKDGKSGDEYIPKYNEKGFVWIKLHLGSKHNINTRHILRMLSSLGVGKKGIGKVEVRRESTFVGVSAEAAQYVVDQTNGTEYRGRKLWSELAKEEKKEKKGPESELVTEDGHLNRAMIEKMANELMNEENESKGERKNSSRDGGSRERDGRGSRDGGSRERKGSRDGRERGSRDNRERGSRDGRERGNRDSRERGEYEERGEYGEKREYGERRFGSGERSSRGGSSRSRGGSSRGGSSRGGSSRGGSSRGGSSRGGSGRGGSGRAKRR